jgi:hypothetical protein
MQVDETAAKEERVLCEGEEGGGMRGSGLVVAARWARKRSCAQLVWRTEMLTFFAWSHWAHSAGDLLSRRRAIVCQCWSCTYVCVCVC